MLTFRIRIAALYSGGFYEILIDATDIASAARKAAHVHGHVIGVNEVDPETGGNR